MRRVTGWAALAALVIAMGCSDQVTEPGLAGDDLTPLFGNHNGNGNHDDAPMCDVVDFSEFTHADPITALSLFGGEVILDVAAVRNTPGGAVDATAYDTGLYNAGSPPPNDTHEDTQAAFGCSECDGIVAMIPDTDFEEDADDTEGGTIILTGFTSDFTWTIPSFDAVDPDDAAQDISLDVGLGQTETGTTDCANNPACGNGEIVTVMASEFAFTDQARFTFEGSGGIDNIQVCREGPGVGRMTGGGGQLTIDDVRVTRGFTIHCDITLSNNLEINWGDGMKWHIDKPLTSAECIDDPAVDPAPPPAPFDTFTGEGVGSLNGVDGSVVRFTFVDAGEPGGRNDRAEIKIWAPGDDPDTDPPVLDVPMSFLDHGNIQAHYDQPHGSNHNK